MGHNKLSQEKIDSWKSTQMLIIDEVSLTSEHLLQKPDKHIRILAAENGIMFGGYHIIFVGDFDSSIFFLLVPKLVDKNKLVDPK